MVKSKVGIKAGFVMDPIASINPKKDTSLAMMLEAQSRGWSLAYMELGDLQLISNQAHALMHPIKVFNNLDHYVDLSPASLQPLNELDVIFMRKDPPFDMQYVTATYILERAHDNGVLVVNNPKSLRDFNEKIYASDFPNCSPPSVLSRSIDAFLHFLDEHKKMVIKPIDLMGGQSIFVVEKGDVNTHVMLENITQRETKFIQAQVYIPEIETIGDKRIMLIDGTAIPYGIRRIPHKGDHRGNMAVGASVEGFVLNERDHWICNQIGPDLKEKGLSFVGIDVIGDFLTEINVTSPTGVREIDNFFNTNICGELMDAIELRLDFEV